MHSSKAVQIVGGVNGVLRLKKPCLRQARAPSTIGVSEACCLKFACVGTNIVPPRYRVENRVFFVKSMRKNPGFPYEWSADFPFNV